MVRFKVAKTDPAVADRKRPRPPRYICVAGPRTQHEGGLVVDAFRDETRDDPRPYRVMVGVLMTRRVLAGDRERHPQRYPLPAHIARIFQPDPMAINAVIYRTDQPATLAAQIRALLKTAGSNLHCVRLCDPWPPTAQLEEIRATFPQLRLAITLDRDTFHLPNGTDTTWPGEGDPIAATADTVTKRYGTLADDVHFDLSAGNGKHMPLVRMVEAMALVHERCPRLGLALSGDVGPYHMQPARAAVRALPRVASFSAGSGLRDTDDRLSPERIRRFMAKSVRMLDYYLDAG